MQHGWIILRAYGLRWPRLPVFIIIIIISSLVSDIIQPCSKAVLSLVTREDIFINAVCVEPCNNCVPFLDCSGVT